MRGSSPLQAALRRLVADELTQHTENQEACTVLFDVESFYDSISLSLVARAGLKLAYILPSPPSPLFYWVWHYSLVHGFVSQPQGAVVSAKELSSAMGWQRDALRAITLQGWRSTTSCRSRTSCTRPPRLRNGWTIWHSARKLRRAEVVSKAVEAALQLVQDLQGNKLAVASKSVVIATTSLIAKQVVSSLARHDIHIQEASQARIWVGCVKRKKADASYHGQEMGQGGKTNEKVCWRTGVGRRKLMVQWARRHRGSSKRERELLKQHNAEVEAGV